jgi:CheY-like chemotaxis protein
MILLTIDAEVDPARLHEMGFAGHMTKPVRQSQLFDTIMDAIATTNAKPGLLEGQAPMVNPFQPPALAATRGARILLAEDNKVNQIVAGEILARSGYLHDVVGDGGKVLAALKKQHYDLVLMDCQMPVMDGFEAATAIRQSESGGRHIPIIALTANAIKGDRERCLAAGMDAYCSKPVNPKRLIETIETLLAKHGVVGNGESSPPVGTESARAIEKRAPFDLNSLLARCMQSASVVSEVLDEFESQASTDLARLEQSLSSGDSEKIARIAHALKGAAGVLSALDLTQIAAELEKMARAGNLQHVEQPMGRLRLELQRCVEHIPKVRAEISDKQF